MEYKKPNNWSQVLAGSRVQLQSPHPEALTNPKFFGETIWKHVTVEESRKGLAKVKLPSGGVVDVKSLEALRVEGEDKKAKSRTLNRGF